MKQINIVPVPFENLGWAACSVTETLSPYFPSEAQALAWIEHHRADTAA